MDSKLLPQWVCVRVAFLEMQENIRRVNHEAIMEARCHLDDDDGSNWWTTGIIQHKSRFEDFPMVSTLLKENEAFLGALNAVRERLLPKIQHATNMIMEHLAHCDLVTKSVLLKTLARALDQASMVLE